MLQYREILTKIDREKYQKITFAAEPNENAN